MVWQPNKFNSGNFNATNLKLAERFDDQFSHLSTCVNIFAHVQGHGFDAVAVTRSKYLSPFTEEIIEEKFRMVS